MAHGLEAEYRIVVVSRTPNQSAPPTLTDIGELEAVGSISYADILNEEGELSLSVEPEKISSDVASRLNNILDTPTEIHLFRDNSKIWAGTLLSCQLQGPTLTLNARGLLYYTRYMTLESDLLFATPTDQYTIGKGLIDTYQALDYGNYGLDTSGIGLSGTTRTRTYHFVENQNVFDRLIQLAEVDGGFDFWVDPNTRDVMFAASKGTDRTQAVFADEANVIDPNVFWSVAEDDIASDAIAVGVADNEESPVIVGVDSNLTLRQTFGRVTVFRTFEDVTTQATIDGHATRLLSTRAAQMLVPSPAIIPIVDVVPGEFETGDLITYTVEIGTIGILSVARRLRMVRVSVDEDGVESMNWELI